MKISRYVHSRSFYLKQLGGNLNGKTAIPLSRVKGFKVTNLYFVCNSIQHVILYYTDQRIQVIPVMTGSERSVNILRNIEPNSGTSNVKIMEVWLSVSCTFFHYTVILRKSDTEFSNQQKPKLLACEDLQRSKHAELHLDQYYAFKTSPTINVHFVWWRFWIHYVRF